MKVLNISSSGHMELVWGCNFRFMNDGSTGSGPAEDVRGDTGSPWFHFNKGLQAGQQYGPTVDGEGGFHMTADGRIAISKLYMEKQTAVPMDYTPELNFDNPLEAVFSQDQINREYVTLNGNLTPIMVTEQVLWTFLYIV